jgi:hypothetical protein
MSDKSLFLKYDQHRMDGGVCRRIGDVILDFPGGGTFSFVDNIHHLSFSLAQIILQFMAHQLSSC